MPGAVPTGSGWLTICRDDGTWADGGGTEKGGYRLRCLRIVLGTLKVAGKKERREMSGCRRDGEDRIAVAEWHMWGPNKDD